MKINKSHLAGIFTAVFLLFPADFLSTSLALSKYGVNNETNPIMRELFKHSILLVAIANLTIMAICVLLLAKSISYAQKKAKNKKERKEVNYITWAGLSVFNILGIIIVVNNLSYYYTGMSPIVKTFKLLFHS